MEVQLTRLPLEIPLRRVMNHLGYRKNQKIPPGAKVLELIDDEVKTAQGLIESKDLSPRPFIPINKPGGSGGEALRYLQDKAGDDHTVLVTLGT